MTCMRCCRLRAPVWRELQVSVLARVRASAQRLAAELLGADLMGVAAAEQQVRWVVSSRPLPTRQ